MKQLLEKLLLIKTGEWARVILACLLLFLLASILLIMRAVIGAIYLSRPDVSGLPYMYIGVALVMASATSLLTRLSRGFPANRVMYLTYTGYSLFLGLLYYMIGRVGDWYYPFLYISGSVVSGIAIVQGWVFISALFNPREAKRLFGVIGMGGTLAGIASGFGVKIYTQYLSADTLLLLCGGYMLGAGCTVFLLSKAAHYSFSSGQSKKQSRAGSGFWLRDRFLLNIIAVTVLASLAVAFSDYLFKMAARAKFSGDDLAAFIGMFYGVANIVTLVYSVFLSSRAITFLGVRNAGMVMPAELLAGSVLFLISPGIAAGIVLKFGITSINYTIHNASHQMLFLPLTKEVRSRFKAFAGGIVKPLAGGLAGILLLILSRIAPRDSFALFGIVLGCICFLWLISSIPLRRGYMQALYRTLQGRSIDIEDLTEAFQDKATLQALETELDSPDPVVAVYAFDLLHELAPRTAADCRIKMLNHPSPDAVAHVLKNIEDNPQADLLADLQKAIAAHPELTSAAAGALAACGGPSQWHSIVPGMKETDQRVDSIIALIRFGDEEYKKQAAEACLELASSQSHADRLDAAKAVRGAGITNCPDAAAALKDDADTDVRMEIIYVVGQVYSDENLTYLLRMLPDRQVRPAVLDVIGGFPGADQKLADLFHAGLEGESREAVIEALGRQNTVVSINALLEILKDNNAEDLLPAVRALARIHQQEPGLPIPDTPVLTIVDREIERYALYSQPWEAVTDIPGGAQLLETLVYQRLGVIMQLLGLLFGQKELQAAYAGLAPGGNRANALELIDSRTAWSGKRTLLAVLESTAATIDAVYFQEFSKKITSFPEAADILNDDILGALRVLTDSNDYSVASDDSRIVTREAYLYRQVQLNAAVAPDLQEAFERIKEKPEMSSTIERILFLKQVAIFRELNSDYLLHIARTGEEVIFMPGEAVCRDGDTDRSLHIIITGSVNIEKGGAQIARLGPADCIGEMALLDGQPRSADAIAAEETRCLKIGYQDFFDLIAVNVGIAKGVFRVLSGRLRSMLEAKQEV